MSQLPHKPLTLMVWDRKIDPSPDFYLHAEQQRSASSRGHDDPLAPARGIIWGNFFGALMWLMILAPFFIFVRSCR